MAYNYLLEMHELINKKKEAAQSQMIQAKAKEKQDPLNLNFHQGRLDVLVEVQEYLTQQYNPKLPRKIRSKRF